jgi:hypothetical protein
MKICETPVLLFLFFALILTSCSTPPVAGASGKLPAPSSGGQNSVLPANTEKVPAPVAVTAPVVPIAEPSAPISLKPAEALVVPSVPRVSDPVPSPPPEEKILYFYPEPDLLVPAPEKSPAAKTQGVVAEPAPKKDIPAPKDIASVDAKKMNAKTAPAATTAPAAEKSSPAKPEVPATDAVLPGIWKNEPVASAPVIKQDTPVTPSRSVTLSTGQTLEVWYPGSGWVFLGDSSAQNGLKYETRKMDKADTLFNFRALKAGSYLLEFSRYDVLKDAFSSDSLSVTVTDSSVRMTDSVRAPDYRAETAAAPAVSLPPAVPGVTPATIPVPATTTPVLANEPGLAAPSSLPSSGAVTATLPVTSASVTALAAAGDPAAVLDQVRKALSSGNPSGALSILDQYFSTAVTSLDEAWFLRGQAYEANSPARDIRKALSAYETLVAAYPDSPLWKDADARIRYIKQFYFTIR